MIADDFDLLVEAFILSRLQLEYEPGPELISMKGRYVERSACRPDRLHSAAWVSILNLFLGNPQRRSAWRHPRNHQKKKIHSRIIVAHHCPKCMHLSFSPLGLDFASSQTVVSNRRTAGPEPLIRGIVRGPGGAASPRLPDPMCD